MPLVGAAGRATGAARGRGFGGHLLPGTSTSALCVPASAAEHSPLPNRSWSLIAMLPLPAVTGSGGAHKATARATGAARGASAGAGARLGRRCSAAGSSCAAHPPRPRHILPQKPSSASRYPVHLAVLLLLLLNGDPGVRLLCAIVLPAAAAAVVRRLFVFQWRRRRRRLCAGCGGAGGGAGVVRGQPAGPHEGERQGQGVLLSRMRVSGRREESGRRGLRGEGPQECQSTCCGCGQGHMRTKVNGPRKCAWGYTLGAPSVLLAGSNPPLRTVHAPHHHTYGTA